MGRPRPARRSRLVIPAAEVQLGALGGSASDAAEDGRVEGEYDEHRRHYGADDHERDVEDDVDVVHVRQDVAVGETAARVTPVHDADREGREAGQGDAGDRLGEDDSTGV